MLLCMIQSTTHSHILPIPMTHTLDSRLHSGSSVSPTPPQRNLRLLRRNRCVSIVVWCSTKCVRVFDILKLHLFVLHNTDTITFPLLISRFLRYNKLEFYFRSSSCANQPWSVPLPPHCVPLHTLTHDDPSHSETSRLLTSPLSLGVPFPRSTQCMWDV